MEKRIQLEVIKAYMQTKQKIRSKYIPIVFLLKYIYSLGFFFTYLTI